VLNYDKFIYKSYQLGKGRIINKIRFMADKIKIKKVASRNIPFVILRWPIVELKLKYLHNFKIDCQFSFPFKEKFTHTDFNLSSG